MKRLYFGDCLEILKVLNQENPNGFIDLIYIDPPFNSKRDYNILFESHDIVGDATAQKQAFADTWSNVSYIDELNEIQLLDLDLYQFLQSLHNIRISNSTVAYLTTMAIRIYYMQKVLKGTGSFYLHCDSNMSHYLKLLCDIIFGRGCFRNEIIWQRTNAHNMKAQYYGRVHDVILFYTKSESYTWNQQYVEYSEEQMKRFKADSDGRLYTGRDLTYSAKNSSRNFEWRGSRPPAQRSWGASLDQLEKWWSEGKILCKADGTPRLDGLKVYLDELKGKMLIDLWIDIARIANTSDERLDYPTQKPEELLKRIISTSSNEGDLVADFFCGCGTTISVAEKLKRNWIGVDISHLAIRLIKDRLSKPFIANKTMYKKILDSIEIHGLPKDIGSAKELAKNTEGGRLEFQDWIIEVMLGGVSNIKKTADGGYDGYLTFNKTEKQKEIVLIEVKSGNVNVKNLREFIQVIKTNNAAIGVFVCFAEQVTKPMLLEAKQEGYYDQETWGQNFDKIQLITVEDLFEGKLVLIPESTKNTFKTAQFKYKKPHQGTLFTKE